MAKPFKTLRDKMKPEQWQAAEEKAKKMLAEMPLQGLRQTSHLTGQE